MSKITWEQYQEISTKMILDFLKDSDPKDRHRLVLGWNWDSGTDVLKWIANDSDTDKATALAIYWTACPRANSKPFENREEVLERASYSINEYDLIEAIEQLYLSGFYKNQRLAFDPTNDKGTNWTTEYLDKPVKREIPSTMFGKLTGEDISSGYDEGWEEGIPPHIWEKMREYEVVGLTY